MEWTSGRAVSAQSSNLIRKLNLTDQKSTAPPALSALGEEKQKLPYPAAKTSPLC